MSLISEWRTPRDVGILAGKRPEIEVGELTAEQTELARLHASSPGTTND
ncbi:MAG: hypothetical protein WAX14_12495 [Rhodococcus sp. (in: high G+C Gram-positive bacteria)]